MVKILENDMVKAGSMMKVMAVNYHHHHRYIVKHYKWNK